MEIKEFKSIYPISKLKYLWTMITGRHFVVSSITDGETQEQFGCSEPLLTIGKDCFILTDLNSSINSANKRAPLIIKILTPADQDMAKLNPYLPAGLKAYTDEKGEDVLLTKVRSSSFLTFKVNKQAIVLRLSTS